jgi:hypothetical protein
VIGLDHPTDVAKPCRRTAPSRSVHRPGTAIKVNTTRSNAITLIALPSSGDEVSRVSAHERIFARWEPVTSFDERV